MAGTLDKSTADAPDQIPWHPAFYAATDLELQEDKDILQLEQEYPLSREPIRIDLLISKNNERAIKNEIGHIMRTYNIIEYKNPKDGMNIDDFAKTLGYALLYKGYGKKVNQVPMEELSASMFRAVYPREMFAQLRKQGHEIVEKYPGIYYIQNNLLFPVQVIVTSELDPELHRSLRILTDRVEIEDVRQFLKEARTRSTPGERNDIDALLQASVAANFEVYEEIRRNSVMCEALRTLMKDEIEAEREAGQKEGLKEGERRGRKEGRKEGQLGTLIDLVRDNLITISEAAKRAEMTEASFAVLLNEKH
jgi:hypothetical protein